MNLPANDAPNLIRGLLVKVPDHARDTFISVLAEAQLPFIGAARVTVLDGRYPAIRQDAALLARRETNPAAAAFWAFLSSDAAPDHSR